MAIVASSVSFGDDTFATHRNGIRDSNGVVLPRQHALLFHGSFDGVPKTKHYMLLRDQRAAFIGPKLGMDSQCMLQF